MSYAFSGSVLFQYCNVIFLVSTAWLPLAVLSIDRMLSERSWKWAAALAVTLTMMILGGDPQMAYHAALIAVLYALVQGRVRAQSRPRVLSRLGDKKNAVATESDDTPRQPRQLIPRPPGTGGLLFSRPVLIAGALLFTFLLSAAQILPSAAWSRGSTRAAYDSPRNIYELAGTCNEKDDIKDRFGFLLGRTTDGHHAQSYQYSVAPWHAADFLWPNCFGRVFPQNTRWIRALPAEGRTWTPTLYMGLLPLLLALSQLNFFGRAFSIGRARLSPSQRAELARQELRPPSLDDARRIWLSWVVLLAMLAAMGWYSLGWLIAEIYHATYGGNATGFPIGSPFGGVYWLLQTVLPGYVYFRYPAKWLVVAALGLSLLAAFGWDELGGGARRFLLRGLAIVGATSIALLAFACVVIFATPYWNGLADITSKDALFGPLDPNLARWELLGGLLHTTIVAGLLYLLVREARQSGGAVWLLLILTAADIAVAQRGLAPTAPAATIEDDSPLVTEMREMLQAKRDSALRTPHSTLRTYRRHWLPRDWAKTSSPDRQIAGTRFDRETLFPKYELLEDVEIVQASSAFESLDHREFMRVVLREKMLPAIGTQFVIGHADASGLTAKAQKLPAGPRAWIVHNVEVLPPLDSHHPAAVRRRTRIVADRSAISNVDRGAIHDYAVVESDRSLPLEIAAAAIQLDHETCDIVRHTPDCVELHLQLQQPGLIVLADAYTPDWRCEATNLPSGERKTLDVLRTNRVMRGVWLPAGEHYLVFRYQPAHFDVGLTMGLAAWLALMIAGTLVGIPSFSPLLTKHVGKKQVQKGSCRNHGH